MRRFAFMCVALSLLAACPSMGTVFWRPSTNGITPPDTGDFGEAMNWLNSGWDPTNGAVKHFLPNDPLNDNGKAAFPTDGPEAECRVTGVEEVPGSLVLGDNGDEANTAVLRIVSNAVLNAGTSGTWGAIGYNRKAHCIVETGGTLNFGSHMWVGRGTPSVSTLDVFGTVDVDGQTGLGWNRDGGAGFINIYDDGVVNLDQLTDDGDRSIWGDSRINVTGTGQLIYDGSGGSNRVALYVSNGRIIANGVTEDVIINVDTNTDEVIVTAAAVIPDPPLELTSIAQTGGAFDLEWSDIPGKQFDLVSAEDLAIPLDTWPIYNDGDKTYENIPNSGAGLNTLTNVMPVGGPPRFFAVRKEFGDGITLLSEDFDATAALPDGWTAGVTAGTTAWEVGAPTTVGPAAASSLSNCVATGISSSYGANSDLWLRSRDIDLTAAEAATLTFQQSREVEVGSDAGSLRVLRAGDLVQLGDDIINPVAGDDGGAWTKVEVDLPLEATGQTVKIEFQFTSDASNDVLWNSSFEEPVLADQTRVDAEGQHGWQRGRYGLPGEPFRDRDSSGVWISNPDDLNELEFLPDGDNVAWVDGKYDWDVGIAQVLQINLESNTQYDVSAWVASSYNNGDGSILPLPSNRVELVTGDTILAVAPDEPTAAYSTWEERTLSWNSAGDTNGVFGQPLEIRLINVAIGDGSTGGQALGFDDVSITATPSSGPIGFAGWYIDDVEVKTPIP